MRQSILVPACLVLVLVLVLSACAEARVVAPRADAGSRETRVTVVLTRGIVPAIGEPVIFHDADGEPLLETETDARGQATYAPGRASIMVTVIGDLLGSGNTELWSREGLVAGDELRLKLRPVPGEQPGFEVRFPGAVPGASFYTAQVACGNRHARTEDANPVEVPYCDEPQQHVIGLAYGAASVPIAFTFATDLAPRVESVSLPSWRVDFPVPPAALTTVAGVSELEAGVGEPRRGWVGDYLPAGVDVYSVFVRGVTVGVTGERVIHRVESRSRTVPDRVELRADAMRDAPASVRLESVDGRLTYRWDGPLPARTSHFGSINQYRCGEAECMWWFKAAPRPEGVLRFPRLPADVASFAPPASGIRWQFLIYEEDWRDGYHWQPLERGDQPIDGTVIYTSISGEL